MSTITESRRHARRPSRRPGAIHALMALVLCALTASAPAFPGGDRHGPGLAGALSPRALMRMAERLDLSAEQRAAMGQLVDTAFPQIRQLMFALHDERETLRGLVQSERFDDTAAAAVTTRIGELSGQMALLATRTLADMRALLTDEQRARLDTLRARGYRGPGDGRDAGPDAAAMVLP